MRSSWKIPYINPLYFQNSFKKKRTFIIKFKNSVIGRNFVDRRVKLHTGSEWVALDITTQKIGFKFGEFVFSKTSHYYKHLKKSKKKSKKHHQ